MSLASRIAVARSGSKQSSESVSGLPMSKTSNEKILSTDSSSFLHPNDLITTVSSKKSSNNASGTTYIHSGTSSRRKPTESSSSNSTSCSSYHSKNTPISIPGLSGSSGHERTYTPLVHPTPVRTHDRTTRENVLRQATLSRSSNSSSIRNSICQGLVTPNVCNYSGNASSLSKSSTTPTTCTSFKVVAVVEGRGAARGEIGMAYVDLKNPLLVLSQFADNQAYVRLAVQLNILRPIEVILPHTVMESRSKIIVRIREMFPEIVTVTVPRKHFNETKGLQCIQDLCVPEYKTVEVEVASKYYCLSACSALIKYVEFKQSMSYASHSLRIVYRTIADTAMISTSTARNLELVTNEVGKTEHSLYGVLNYTLTPGGDRMLRANILQPPCDINTINTRLDCIAELMDNEDLFNDLKSVIGKFMDTEHMLSLCIQIQKEKSIRNSEQKIANVISLKHALDLVKPLHNFLSNAKNALFKTYFQALSDERFQDLQEKIGLVIHNDARWQKGTLNMHMQKCFAVKSNINGLLDIARRAYSESVNDVSDIVKQLEKQYDIPLSLGYNVLRGFFIQIHIKAIKSLENLPSIFIKVNKYKTLISCTTEDLIKLNDRIRESLNEIYLMSDIIIDEVINEVRENIGCLYSLTEAVSSIDFLVSLTHACTLSNHVRPEFSNVLAIKGGRHPVIEKIIGTTFIPNDIFMCEEMNFIILSGANMSGKTTYLKQVAVLQIMAQIGCFLPAEYASIKIAHQILTRMGNNSDIEKSYSAFMLQMKETNFILQHATDKSLIILDELGKGTSIEEGCSIAFAICEQLLTKKAFTIFSTHFMLLTELSCLYPNVANFHFRVDYNLKENEGCVCNFSHELNEGPCKEKYYGIKTAALSSLPHSVLEEAKTFFRNAVETEREGGTLNRINEEMKEKIKIAIHLIHLSQNEYLNQKNLIDHLCELKSQFLASVSPSQVSSVSSNSF